MSESLIRPHGGKLVNRWADPQEAARIEREAPRLPRLVLSRRQQSDLQLIASGAYSPLEGFMGHEDLYSVLQTSRLSTGAIWTIPITLAVQRTEARRLPIGHQVALYDSHNTLLGLLHLRDRFSTKPEEIARCVFGTTDSVHPGVRRLREEGRWLLGGQVTVLRRSAEVEFPKYHLDPIQTRALIRERGWKTVVGFQTRNPIHRAHEFMLKSALEIFDGLMIHPLVGETQPSDIPARVRLRCYEVLLEGYYPRERTLLTVLPAVMRFAGPREAIFHALVRKNYGCTHFIVGRDHAGVGNFYGPYDAQRAFDDFPPEEVEVVPLRFEHTFYCGACQAMASSKTCPHPASRHVVLSGTKVREMLARREAPPVEFTRPEVAQVLMEMYANPENG